jgi:peptidoglycan/LPS O-acetylase OafA/YrhL
VGFWFSFLAGVAAQFGLRYRGPALYFAWIFIVALASLAVLNSDSFAGLSAATAAALLLAGKGSGMSHWLSAEWLQFLGKISYSLYLLHSPITGTVYRVVNHFGADTPITELLGAALSIALCFLVAWVAYLLIEKPAMSWSHIMRFRNNLRAERPRKAEVN